MEVFVDVMFVVVLFVCAVAALLGLAVVALQPDSIFQKDVRSNKR